MDKRYIFGLGTVLLIFVGIYLLTANKKTIIPESTTVGAKSSSSPLQTFTLDQIASHNTEQDCYIAIEGKVYDVTKFIPSHPGGKAILQGCGRDATSLFNNRKGTGEGHSSMAHELLTKFFIGNLVS